MREIRTSGSMSGCEETELWNGYLGTPRGNGEPRISRSYRHGATTRLYAGVPLTLTLPKAKLDLGLDA
jgi:hypothetical protein